MIGRNVMPCVGWLEDQYDSVTLYNDISGSSVDVAAFVLEGRVCAFEADGEGVMFVSTYPK